MSATYLAWLIPTAVAVLGALLRITRQAGRIEEGVKGLYGRVQRLEEHQDSQSRRYSSRSDRND